MFPVSLLVLRMVPLALTHVQDANHVTVRRPQRSYGHVTLRVVNALASPVSTGQTVGSALQDSGTTDPTDARVSEHVTCDCGHLSIQD